MKVIKMILLLCNLEVIWLFSWTLWHWTDWFTIMPWIEQVFPQITTEHPLLDNPRLFQLVPWRTSVEEHPKKGQKLPMLTDYCKIREHSPLALVHFIMIITKNVPRPICFRFYISLMHIMHITHMCVLLSF